MDRFENWDNSMLSMVSKVELIHTVTLMVLYWLLVYHMPTAALIKLDSLCADFFWTGKKIKLHGISSANLC